jgi:phosphoribosyl-AMP cyclohydrolase
MNWLDQIKWDEKGLVPVIAQERGSNDVLMFAWMNREALQQTAQLGRAVYFSRSRNRLWHKGEESGNVQTVHEIRMDCDSDVILLKVTQPGSPVEKTAEHGDPAEPSAHNASHAHGHAQSIACHTGRHSCFFSLLKDGQWQITEPVLKDPAFIYK